MTNEYQKIYIYIDRCDKWQRKFAKCRCLKDGKHMQKQRNWRHNSRQAQYLDLQFYDGHKKGWQCVRANNSHFIRFLYSFSRRKKKEITMLFTNLAGSILEESVPLVSSTQDLRHNFFQYQPCSRWITYIYIMTVSTLHKLPDDKAVVLALQRKNHQLLIATAKQQQQLLNCFLMALPRFKN